MSFLNSFGVIYATKNTDDITEITITGEHGSDILDQIIDTLYQDEYCMLKCASVTYLICFTWEHIGSKLGAVASENNEKPRNAIIIYNSRLLEKCCMFNRI